MLSCADVNEIHKLNKVQVAEAATHIAFYAGWARAMAAPTGHSNRT